jgi:hypothetical protein
MEPFSSQVSECSFEKITRKKTLTHRLRNFRWSCPDVYDIIRGHYTVTSATIAFDDSQMTAVQSTGQLRNLSDVLKRGRYYLVNMLNTHNFASLANLVKKLFMT